MRFISSEDASLNYGITTRHEEMDNGELRFRLEKQDGVAYIQTVASAHGGWQQSHCHATATETYIVQLGWIVHASLLDGAPQFSLVSAGESITTAPGVIHNIYMPPNAVMHTLKHGNASTGEAVRNEEAARFDAVTQCLSEGQLLKLATTAKGVTSQEVLFGAMTTKAETPEFYSQDYRHFDILIWQVPTWSSAIFALTAVATGAVLSNAEKAVNSFGVPAATVLAYFLGTVTFVLLLLWNVLLRFRMRQAGMLLHPDTFIPPKLFLLPGGQLCLQLIVAVETAVLLAASLLTGGVRVTCAVIVVIGLPLALMVFSELAVKFAKNQAKCALTLRSSGTAQKRAAP